LRSHAFSSANPVPVSLGGQVCHLTTQRIDGRLYSLPFRGAFVFARGTEQAVAGILDFAGDDLTRDGRALRDIVGHAEMSAAQCNARVGHTRHARLQVAVFAQKIDRHTMFPAQIERGRADCARTKDADRFEVMDGNRQLPNVEGRFPVALLGRQAVRVDRHLDLKREVIPADVAAGCQEIERVLLDVHAALDVKFEI